MSLNFNFIKLNEQAEKLIKLNIHDVDCTCFNFAFIEQLKYYLRNINRKFIISFIQYLYTEFCQL